MMDATGPQESRAPVVRDRSIPRRGVEAEDIRSQVDPAAWSLPAGKDVELEAVRVPLRVAPRRGFGYHAPS
jgi:hypothetical protein